VWAGLFSLGHADVKKADNGHRDGDMERDVELALSRELAAVQATLVEFAKDTGRRLERIEEQTTKTNGRVDRLEQVTAVQAGVQQAMAVVQQRSDSKPPQVVVGTEVVTLTNFKWWLAIAIGCFGAGAAFAGIVGWVS
jgi:hypothetical protein